MTLGQMESPSSFEPIYPEWQVERDMRKMERKESRKRLRAEVLQSMKQYNEKPLPICLRCDKTCIQRQVVGLTNFICYKKYWK